MKIISESDIEKIVRSDEWMMDCLRAAAEFNLPDSWIAAGFLRNKVWDYISGNEKRNIKDVDLVYYNSDDLSTEVDYLLDDEMNERYPFADWEVRNQARMHIKNGFDEPYLSTIDGISNMVETATSVGVRLNKSQLEFVFCHSIDDLVNLVARPIPRFANDERLLRIYKQRIDDKKWREKWPAVKILNK